VSIVDIHSIRSEARRVRVLKPKKIPRKIQAYLILLGLFFGQVIALFSLLGFSAVYGSLGLAIVGWGFIIGILYIAWFLLSFKYREDLADWGLIDKPKKKKETKKQ
jgi:hypothetical protein